MTACHRAMMSSKRTGMQAPELVSIKMESTVPNQGGRPRQKQQGCGLCREMCCLFSSQTSRQVVCCPHGEGEQSAEKQHRLAVSDSHWPHLWSMNLVQGLCSRQCRHWGVGTTDSSYFQRSKQSEESHQQPQIQAEAEKDVRIQESDA